MVYQVVEQHLEVSYATLLFRHMVKILVDGYGTMQASVGAETFFR